MFRTSLSPDALQRTLARLGAADSGAPAAAEGFEGRQPVHTVYGGAHLFRAGTARKLGDLALAALREHAPDAAAFAEAMAVRRPGAPEDEDLAGRVHARVIDKLEREPVEDLRIDFEDGYGARGDAEEDGHAAAAAREVARGLAAGTLPPFLGIRIKSLGAEVRRRSLRTLDIFLSTLTEESGGALPPEFVVTLPKISAPEEVEALADVLDDLERALGLSAGGIRVEIMIETPRAILGPDGKIALPRLLSAARGRCTAAHLGPFDYTASLGVIAAHQGITHPACDLARDLMTVALAGTGVRLSDGPTNVLPVPIRRAAPGEALDAGAIEENRRAIHDAWRLHVSHIDRALVRGIYQGWDLHPAQLPARYAAVYAFFLRAAPDAGARLRAFVDKAAQATLAGGVVDRTPERSEGSVAHVVDDAATGQGLLNFFLRAVAAGALLEEEAVAQGGLSLDELRGRSFARIVAARRSSMRTSMRSEG